LEKAVKGNSNNMCHSWRGRGLGKVSPEGLCALDPLILVLLEETFLN